MKITTNRIIYCWESVFKSVYKIKKKKENYTSTNRRIKLAIRNCDDMYVFVFALGFTVMPILQFFNRREIFQLAAFLTLLVLRARARIIFPRNSKWNKKKIPPSYILVYQTRFYISLYVCVTKNFNACYALEANGKYRRITHSYTSLFIRWKLVAIYPLCFYVPLQIGHYAINLQI